MLSSPKHGQRVRIHYRASMAGKMPLHGKVGVVVVSGCGRPRNHGIEIEGRIQVVPAGNIIKEPPCPTN